MRGERYGEEVAPGCKRFALSVYMEGAKVSTVFILAHMVRTILAFMRSGRDQSVPTIHCPALNRSMLRRICGDGSSFLYMLRSVLRQADPPSGTWGLEYNKHTVLLCKLAA